MSIAATCPCCGQTVESSRLLVDLETNSATRHGVTAVLSPRMAIILSILSEAFPATVRHDRMLMRIFGADGGPEDTITMRVHISHARKAIAALGAGIEPVWGVGYRLVLDPRAAGVHKARGRNFRWAPDELKRLERLVYVSRLSIREAAIQLGRSPGGTVHKVRQIALSRGTGDGHFA